MGLLMLSTALDYAYGFWVASPNRRKAKLFLWLSVINNLGILGVFKYYNFFALQFQKGFELIGLHTNPVLLNVALPIGISFYTFHGMSYVFDIYRGEQKPVSNFVDYAVFVSFFPLLVAGPIERANHLLPQVQKNRYFDLQLASDGLKSMIWGFFKKVVVADNLAPAVNDIFNSYSEYSSLTLLFGAIYFSFQIYCDFSGYTDIARGLANLFGFQLLNNFNNPYLSSSIPEFWKRWHMSLSGWFRDYLYFPLGGSRVGFIKSIRNVLIVFVLSGLWHGANLTYVCWGFIHAVCYIPGFIKKRFFNIDILKNRNIYRNGLNIGFTFLIVTLAWIFFRSTSIADGIAFVQRIITLTGNIGEFMNWRSNSTEGSHIEFLFVLLLFFVFNLIRRRAGLITFSVLTLLAVLCFGMYFNLSSFIYFQF